MDSNITVAIVSASSAVIVAVAALVANVVWMGRAFGQLDKRISTVETGLGEVRSEIAALRDMLVGKIIEHGERLSKLEK